MNRSLEVDSPLSDQEDNNKTYQSQNIDLLKLISEMNKKQDGNSSDSDFDLNLEENSEILN